jgi:Tol biopolymer transport system component
VTTASDSYRDSAAANLSADATVIAFSSDSDFLGQGIPNNQSEIWPYDTATMTYMRVTAASDVNRSSYAPSLSVDTTVIAFDSDSDFLGQGIPRGQWEILLYRPFEH